MDIEIIPASSEDIHELAQCVNETIHMDPLQVAIFGEWSKLSEEQRSAVITRRESVVAIGMRKSHVHYFKAVNAKDGTMVGFTCFAEPEQRMADSGSAAPNPSSQSFASHINFVLLQEAQARLNALTKDLMDGRKDYWCTRAEPSERLRCTTEFVRTDATVQTSEV